MPFARGYFQRGELAPEQHAAEDSRRRRDWQAIQLGVDSQLRGLDVNSVWPPVDPREEKAYAAATAGLLSPIGKTPSAYERHAGAAIDAPLQALSYVFGAPARARDALIVSAQDLNSRLIQDEDTGEWRPFDPVSDVASARRMSDLHLKPDPAAAGRAATSLAQGIASVVYPPAAARDWRDSADRLGVSPGNIAAIDILTDPLTYYGMHQLPGVSRIASRMPKATNPVFLEDMRGNVIRQLRAGPAVRRPATRLLIAN